MRSRSTCWPSPPSWAGPTTRSRSGCCTSSGRWPITGATCPRRCSASTRAPRPLPGWTGRGRPGAWSAASKVGWWRSSSATGTGRWPGSKPPKPPYPQPGLALFTAGRLVVLAGQGRAAPPGELAGLREWRPVDGLVAVLTAVGGMQLVANAGYMIRLGSGARRGCRGSLGPCLGAAVPGPRAACGPAYGGLRQRGSPCRAFAPRPDAAPMWRAVGAGGRGARRARVLARVPLCIGRVRDSSVGSPAGGREPSAAVARRLYDRASTR